MRKLSILEQAAPIRISVTLSTSKALRKENKKYLNRDYPTDVLSFELREQLEDGSSYLGDVLVSKDQAKHQAKNYGNTWEQEIAELVAHGVLHLLGVHHKDDDEHSVHGVQSKNENNRRIRKSGKTVRVNQT